MTSISVPQADITALRERGFNVSKVCRVAIRKILSEESISEKESGEPAAKQSPRTVNHQASVRCDDNE